MAYDGWALSYEVQSATAARVVLKKDGELKAEITRVIFLGKIYEYRINLSGVEIRIQQDSFTAAKNGILKVGDICGVELKNIRYYDKIEEVD